MRKTILIVCGLFAFVRMSAIHVIIIESQTSASWAIQDNFWQANAIALGYTAEVVPQSALDNLSNLSTADILVVSSGIQTFLSPNHINTVTDFVIGGRSAYIQSEYQTTFQGNITFQAVMDAANADFVWTAGVSGQLVPMNILGELATTPNTVATLDYFNYGYAGEGEDVDPILEYQGNYLGFCYVDPLSNFGSVITISDEDWAWNDASSLLMQNILYKLVQGTSFTASMPRVSAVEIYPNPFVNETTISFAPTILNAKINLINAMGEVVRTINSSAGGRCVIQREGLAAGTYFIQIISDSVVMETKRIVIVG